MDGSRLEQFAKRMRGEDLPEIAIRAFLRALAFVEGGGATAIPESAIEPVDSLPALGSLAGFEALGREAARRTAVIKLNGGLGTSMGLSKAKSLLPIREGLSFLDLIAQQVLWQRKAWGVELPLVLMNSYRTRADSLSALAKYPELEGRLPLDFVQHRVPRIEVESWTPVEWPEDPSLEWCPPGHGDLYIALASSGMLDRLLESGIRHAFVSNADNLGAVLDPAILGWLVGNELPFAMEVARRTESDRKGGHLAHRNGRLMLREVAQCPEADLASFQDIEKHHFFNTNNLWLDLEALAAILDASPAGLSLPVICNEKNVSPTDPSSPRCYQLETAMGSAIECFEGAAALVVPRERFAPVKTTNDLLALWSDAYRMTEDARMVPTDPELDAKRVIDLDPRFYGFVEDLQARFAEGAPSLVRCRRLSVTGNYSFGANVTVEGVVSLVHEGDEPIRIAPGTTLSGTS